MNWIERFLNAISVHKDDASAHHTKTVAGDIKLADLAEKNHASLANVTPNQHHASFTAADHTAIGNGAPHHAKTTSASELTSGVLPSIDRLPALTTGKIWQGNANRPVEVDSPLTPPAFAAGDLLLHSNDTEESTPNSSAGLTPYKLKEIFVPHWGTLRVKFDLATSYGTAHAQIYRDGIGVGTERTTTSESYVTFSQDIAGWEWGSLLQLYGWHPGWTGASPKYAKVKNFRVYANRPAYQWMTFL